MWRPFLSVSHLIQVSKIKTATCTPIPYLYIPNKPFGTRPLSPNSTNCDSDIKISLSQQTAKLNLERKTRFGKVWHSTRSSLSPPRQHRGLEIKQPIKTQRPRIPLTQNEVRTHGFMTDELGWMPNCRYPERHIRTVHLEVTMSLTPEENISFQIFEF